MKSLFVVGPPGVGKTTLVRLLLGMQGRELPLGSYLLQKPKWTVTPTILAAGHYTGDTFDGADTVGYGDVNMSLEIWRRELLPQGRELTIFDGDRFSHATALEAVSKETKTMCVHLSLSDDGLAVRRATRGSNQNEAWMKGRMTKARRFAELFGTECLYIDADCEPKHVFETTRAFIGGRA